MMELLIALPSQITVTTPANLSPIASFTATPTNGDAPLEVDFDASNSTDPDGNIVSYAWDFGDGTSDAGEISSKYL